VQVLWQLRHPVPYGRWVIPGYYFCSGFDLGSPFVRILSS